MLNTMIILLRGEVVGVHTTEGHIWFLTLRAEEAGFKVYVVQYGSDHVSEAGVHGWRHVPNPPEVVKLAMMLDN